MCWVCDSSNKKILAESFTALTAKSTLADGFMSPRLGASLAHRRMEWSTKSTTAYDVGEVSPSKVNPFQSSLLILTGDDIPDSIATTRTVTVDGARIVSTIDTLGDQDFFAVQLEAGRIYDIGQYLVSGGPSGVPLADAYLEIYDSNGNLITSADGGGPNTPSGLDALMTFIPQVSGTYYINARAYDNDGTNGTTGDFVGDYELFVTDVTDQPHYVPYYDLDSPLHSIDWGSQVDRTSRNPDGDEGPRPTGNAFTGVGSNPYGIEGKNVITVYFAKAGDVFVSEDPTNPGATENMVAKGLEQWEKDAFLLALEQYANIADLVFVEVDNRAEADFKIITYLGTPGAGASLLGRMSPPNEQNEGQAEFNAGDVRWTEEGLQQGGFYFPTLLHEFGHGLGMAHPHDNGGRSSIMRGGDGGTAGIGGGLGEFDLSQQVFTIMSYNDGWQTSPYGMPRSGGLTATEVDHFGWVGTLSALDIAVMQDKYGVNEDYRTGDDSYVLSDVNGPGNFHSCIWDAGGTDEIVYAGTRDTVIDLRPATLKYEEGGGGWMSYAHGVFAGFTIANGVTIENARSGSGNDRLVGNDAANLLDAGAGDDVLIGGGGNDILVGGAGRDQLSGGAGSDIFRFADGDSTVGANRDHILDFEQGVDRIDLSALGASSFIGSSQFTGSAGQIRSVTTATATIVEVDRNGDGVADMQIEIAGSVSMSGQDFGLAPTGTAFDDRLYGTDRADTLKGLGGNDTLYGLAGNDLLDGGTGNDRLIGGSGSDLLTGGAGADLFVFDQLSDSPAGSGRDIIQDFQSGLDRIDLSAFGELTYIGRKAFGGEPGEVHYVQGKSSTLVEIDLDGDKIADFQIELVGSTRMVQADFLM